MKAVEALRNALSSGKALVVCGAGVSRAATGGVAPGWRDLICAALDRAKSATNSSDADAWVQSSRNLLASPHPREWLEAADIIQRRLVEADGYKEFLRDSVGEQKPSETDLIDAICALGAPISTTNYDDCISLHTKRNWTTWREAPLVARILAGDSDDVWHLHGHWREAESVIFSSRDYERIKQSDISAFMQRHVAFHLTLIFIGCSADGLNDSNVGQLLNWFSTNFPSMSKQHYAIVCDAELKGGWPKAVTPVSCGDLARMPKFLRSLSSPGEGPYRLPPDPGMIGRRDRLEDVVSHLLAGKTSIILPGGPGMGKTTLAISCAHDPRIAERFPRRRFVLLDSATEPRAMITGLAKSLSVRADGDDYEIGRRIESALAAEPTLVIFDNAETVINTGSDEGGNLLRHIAGLRHLSALVTIRGRTPTIPGALTLPDIQPLPANDAKALFLRDAANDVLASDEHLTPLLDALDGHPLSIALLAPHAQGHDDLKLLRDTWNKQKASLLKRGAGDTRLTSTCTSLKASLTHASVNKPAQRLLSLLAYLPVGLSEDDLDELIPRHGNEAGITLKNERLASGVGGRIRVLAPLREGSREVCKAKRPDLDRLFDYMIAVSKRKDRTPAEYGNFDAVALAALKAGRSPMQIATLLEAVANANCRFGAGGASIEYGIERARTLKNLRDEALCTYILAIYRSGSNDQEAASKLHKQAVELYARLSTVERS